MVCSIIDSRPGFTPTLMSRPSMFVVAPSAVLPVSRVLMRPKATQFTVTFMRPHSLASACVRPMMPALAAE